MEPNQQPSVDDKNGDDKPDSKQPRSQADKGGSLKNSVSNSKETNFIALIGQEPAIFNPRHDDHKNLLKKNNLWMMIAKRIGWTEQYCKCKWKALRNQYCRELKRARANPKVVIKWKYFQEMEFMKPYALHRNYRCKMSTRSNREMEEQEAEEQSSNGKYGKQRPNVKTEDWNTYSSSSHLNASSDITSQIMDQMSQSGNNVTTAEEPQEDEDDDPIHTFLNIESYFEKELIKLVQSEEVIYNVKHSFYRNVKLKLQTWQEIARKLKRTVRQCRMKWKALRDQYIRELKRLRHIENAEYLPRWKHYNALQFLEKHLRLKSDLNCSTVSIQKPELEMSIEHLDQEQLITTPREEDQELSQYILSDMFADCGHSQNVEDDQPVYVQNEKHSHRSIEESAHSQTANDDDDEVGAFFRAIAIKIRKSKMSSMAFTELQIDILRVINNAMRDH